MNCPLCTATEGIGAGAPEQGWLVIGYWLAYRFPDTELCLQHASMLERIDNDLLGPAIRTPARLLKLVKSDE
jgi:hypothetical protein